MDPNKALTALRVFTQFRHLVEPHEWQAVATEALDAFHALDEWISNGGALPDAWAEARHEAIRRIFLASSEPVEDPLDEYLNNIPTNAAMQGLFAEGGA